MESDSSHGASLYSYVKRSVDEEEDFHFLGFEALHRINLANFEVELARMKSKFYKDKTISDDDLATLKSKLKEYSK